VKVFRSNCAKCVEFAPVWEELAKYYTNDPKYIIAEVNCSSQKEFCEDLDIVSFPSLQYNHYGDYADIWDAYEGPLELGALKKFTEESVSLQCSVKYQVWCSDEQIELIKKIKAMSNDELSKRIEEMDAALETIFEEAEVKIDTAQDLVDVTREELYSAKAAGDASREESAKTAMERAKRLLDDAEANFDFILDDDQGIELGLMEEIAAMKGISSRMDDLGFDGDEMDGFNGHEMDGFDVDGMDDFGSME